MVFIYGIVSKWYVMIMAGVLVVTFWVFKGLEEAGVLDDSWRVVSEAFQDSKYVARYCVPKIRDLDTFWECLKTPGRYAEDREARELKKAIDSLLKLDNYDPEQDPYSDKNSLK